MLSWILPIALNAWATLPSKATRNKHIFLILLSPKIIVPTAQELKAIADLRLNEAEILFNAHSYDGAAYLCGYVVEVALKARICKHLGLQDYPEIGRYGKMFAVHDLVHLLLLSGLKPEMDIAKNPVVFVCMDPTPFASSTW